MRNKKSALTELSEYIEEANQGSLRAMYNIGIMYYTGELGAINYLEAFKWYKKAAELGLPQAQYNLATMYDYGQGVAQDDKKAFEWYSKASLAGDELAQHNLAYMYEYGQGVDQNLPLAIYWYKKSYINSHDASQVKLIKLGASPDFLKQINDARIIKVMNNNNLFDHKGVSYIKEILKKKGVGECFDVWLEIGNEYIGSAHKDIALIIYDLANNIEDLRDLLNTRVGFSIDKLINDSILSLSQGKGKIKREKKIIEKANQNGLDEDFINLKFHIDIIINYINNDKFNSSKLHVILNTQIQGMIIRMDNLINTKHDFSSSIREILTIFQDIMVLSSDLSKVKDIESKLRKISKMLDDCISKNKRNIIKKSKKTEEFTNLKDLINNLERDLRGLNVEISNCHIKSNSLKGTGSIQNNENFRKKKVLISNLRAKLNKFEQAVKNKKRDCKAGAIEIEKISEKIKIHEQELKLIENNILQENKRILIEINAKLDILLKKRQDLIVEIQSLKEKQGW